jgi:hypothetical protein
VAGICWARRLTARTIGYTLAMGLILVEVVWLMTKVARTEVANRRLVTVGIVVVGAIVVGLLGAASFRSRSR